MEAKLKKAAELRKKAEEKLQSKMAEVEEMSDVNIHKLLHELQVHQIELEMQNEELRKAQVQLEESRQKYSNLYDFAPVGYLTFDKNGLIQEANLTAARLLGVKRSYLLNKPFSFFIHIDDRDIFYLHLRKVFESTTRQSCEVRLKGEGGIEFNAQLDSILWEDSRGNNACRTSVIDVTRRKQAEEFTQNILEGIGEGLVVVDRQYRIITANRAFCNQVKMPAETIKGRHCYEVSHHIDKPCYEVDEECPVKQTFATGKTHTYTHRHYDKEGPPVYVEIKSYPMKGTAAHITSAIEIITDITKTVELEKALKNKINELKESQERFQKISTTAQDAIVMVNNEGTISYWNPSAEKIFGYTEKEANGKSLYQLIIPDRFYEKYIKEFKKFKGTGQGAFIGKTLELSAIKKDGTEFPVELSLSSVKIKNSWNAIGIVKDITKRKQAEEKILHDYHMQNAINSILNISLQSITLEEQLDRILDIIMSFPWLDVQPQSCIFLVEDDPEVLVMKACHNLPTSLPTTCEKVPFGKCLCGRAASTGAIVFVDRCNGYHEMQRLNPSPHGHYCIPIISGQRVLGIINLYVNEGHTRNEEEEKFLSAVVNTLAGIIEWKKAEEALKKSKDKLELRVQERTAELTLSVEELEREITERKQVEKALRASEEQYQNLYDYAPDMYFTIVRDGTITSVNQFGAQYLGYRKEELMGRPVWIVIHKDDVAQVQRNVIEIFRHRFEKSELEFRKVRKDGSTLWVHERTQLVFDTGGGPSELRIICRDITERKLSQEKVKASLKEKKVLLSEIHHRVKNNMQVISSMLYLQSKYIREKKYLDIFKDSQYRIKSMALVHEKLYKSKDLAHINFKDYVRSLTESLFRSYGVSTSKIALKINADDISLGIDTAIPCGLILSEIVSNSLKYAFPEGRQGEIEITFRSHDENEVELTVRDNGVGIPGDIDFRNAESLGLQVIVNLTEHQLQGEIELHRAKGTKFEIKFKERHAAKGIRK
jgi:PAS domain S-box-containing protein